VPRLSHALSRQVGWWAAAGALVSGGAAYLAARRVEWGVFAVTVGNARLRWILLAALTIFCLYVVLALRWWVLLRPRAPVSPGDAFDFTMIGTLAGLLSNARLGDATRAVVLGRSSDASTSLALGVVAVERLLDVGMLATLAVGLSLVTPLASPVRTAVGILMVGAAGTLAAAILLTAGVARVRRVLESWPLFVPVRARLWAGDALGRFVDGLRVIGDVRALVVAIPLSALSWTLAVLATACYLAALDLRAPWPAAAMVVLFVNLGGVIPAAPAGIGVYHYLAMLALTSWVRDPSAALGFAVVSHATSTGVSLILGTWCLFRRGIRWRSSQADRAC
jgi:uncharacterized protein (TIRG00374 family)